MKDTKELTKLLKIMQNNGVIKYKTQEIEIELHPGALFPVEQKKAELSKEEETKQPFTEEEMLMWSAPGSRAV